MEQLVIRKAKKHHLDLIGKTFGRLTVQTLVGFTAKPYGNKTIHEPVYTLKCTCGKIVTLKRVVFKYGNTKSCGCFRRDVVYEKFANNRSVSDVLFYKTRIMNTYIQKANAKGRDFELTFQQFDNLISGNCFFCGATPNTEYRYKKKDFELMRNGIDRLDPNQGYTLSNSVSCCKICNFLKGTLSKEDFISQVRRISSHCALT